FMEHPRDHALTLIPRSPTLFRDAAFYDVHAAADGTMVAGRFALTERTLEEDGIPNASVTLLPRRRRRSRVSRLRERFGGHRARQRAGYGWYTLDDPAASFDAFQLIVNLEQRPHPENRVLLGARQDRLGLPEPELHWRWKDGDQAELDRLRSVIARALEEAALGRVEIQSVLRPDPNAHHHAGTTRMSVDARGGVVDAHGRVHGVANLFVTGASVLPTAGFANPTLTIVALAIRLADHLAERL
ncbi:MAG: GMC oxidoreductase, partial [Gemmatimonadaceae bacterium]